MLETRSLGLIAAGFLLGSIGLKAAKSKPAKKLYVQGVSKAMQVREAGLDIVEQAKANLDDIVAEASYLNEEQAACECGEHGTESEAA